MAPNREETLKKAEKLVRQGKLSEAIQQYVRLVEDQPGDLNAINALGDAYVRAGDVDQAAAVFVRRADHLFGEGFFPKASALYKKALKIKPDHDQALAQLAEIAFTQGVLVDAKAHLKQLADRRRARGDDRGAQECLDRISALEDPPAAPAPPRRAATPAASASETPDELVQRAIDLAKTGKLPAALELMERLTDEALLADDWAEAIGLLRMFVQAEPHIPALIKLVELCVDGGFENWLREAQSVLADAYLDAGKGAAARYILEDLLEHEPESESHRQRLERAREMVGAASSAEASKPKPAPAPPATIPQVEPAVVVAARPLEPPPMEIDLTNMLAGITAPAAPIPTPKPEPEQVEMSDATADYTRGLEQMIGGDTEGAIVTLQQAARAPQWRFKAAYELGRLYIGQGNLRDGVEWLERAAESPVPTPEDGHAVLYDLAAALEQQGEPARALAILIELNADAGEYRDVARRIEELRRAQTGSRSR